MAEPWCEDCLAGCFVGACACPRTFWAGEGFCSSPTTSAAAEDLLPGQRGGRALVRGLRGWLRHRGLRLPNYFLGWGRFVQCSRPHRPTPLSLWRKPNNERGRGPRQIRTSTPPSGSCKHKCRSPHHAWQSRSLGVGAPGPDLHSICVSRGVL